MDELTSTSQTSVKASASYKHYCYLVLTVQRPKFKQLTLLYQVYIVLQTFTILVDPNSSIGLPWNYTSLKYLWLGMGFVSRPDYLAAYFERELAYAIFFICILSCYIANKLYILISIYFKLLKESQISLDSIYIKPVYIRLDVLLRFILFDMFYIPFIYTLPMISSFLSELAYSYLILALLTSVFFALCIEDALFLQLVTWGEIRSRDVISMPWYIAIQKGCMFGLVYSVRLMKYKKNWVAYSLVLIAVGIFVAFQYVRNFPYSKLKRNLIEIGRNFMLAWGGFVMLVAESAGFEDQDSYTSTLVLLLSLTCLSILMKNLVTQRYIKLKNTQQLWGINQLFHILVDDAMIRQTGLDSSFDKLDKIANNEPDLMDDIIKEFMKKYPNNAYITLWLCFYYTTKQYFMPVKILISSFDKLNFSWALFPYKKLVMERLKIAGAASSEEYEVVMYIDFCQKLATLLNQDKGACINLNSFYVELLSRCPDSSKISKYIETLYHKVRTTHYFYRKLNDLYEFNPKVLDYQAGFLDAVENSLEHRSMVNKAIKAHNEELTKFNVFEADARYFDSRNTILVVSLDPETAGDILWLKNAGTLGYVETELEKFNFKSLIPEPIRANHDPHFAKCYNIWGKHMLLYGVLDLVVVDRNQYLVPVYLKARLMNLNDGKMVLILAVKPNLTGGLVAFMSLDGRFITGCTKELAVYLTTVLKCKEAELYSIDMLEYLNLACWTPEVKMLRGYCKNCNAEVYVKTEDLPLGGYTQKILKLYKTGKIYSDNQPVIVQEFTLPSKRIEMHDIMSSLEFAESNAVSSQAETFSPKVAEKIQFQITDGKNEMDDMSSINFSSTVSSMNHNVLKSQKNKVKLSIIRRIRYLKIGILLFALITLVLCTIIVSIYKISMLESDYSTDMISDFGDVTLSSIRFSSLAKELYLNEQGISFNRTHYQIIARLEEESDTLHNKLNSIMGYNNFPEVDTFLDNAILAYWEYDHGKFVPKETTILEFTRRLSNTANSLARAQNITEDNKDLVELYRNGRGKIQKLWNTTTAALVDYIENSIEDKFSVVYYVSYASVAIMSLSITILVAFPLYKLHLYRARVWINIFGIPRSALKNGMNKVKARLVEVHDEEALNVEDSGKGNVRYRVHRIQIILYTMVGLFIAGISIYLIYTNYAQLPDVLSLLDRNIRAISWSKLKNTIMYELMFLLKEHAFGTGLGLSNDASFDGYTEISHAIQDFLYANDICLKNAELSAELWDFHYETYTDFKYGYHTYTLDLINRISLNNQLLHQNYSFFDIDSIQLESDIRNYLTTTDNLLQVVEQEYDAKRNENFNFFLIITIITSVLVILYVFIGVYTVINKLRDLLIKESTIMILLPKSSSQYILQSFKDMVKC